MSQIATSKRGRGGVRKPPLAFTEHGALMAATVLNSPRAIEMSVYIVRAFVQMRSAVAEKAKVARRLDGLEARVGSHDRTIRQMFDVLRELTAPPGPPKRRRIGFV